MENQRYENNDNDNINNNYNYNIVEDEDLVNINFNRVEKMRRFKIQEKILQLLQIQI